MAGFFEAWLGPATSQDYLDVLGPAWYRDLRWRHQLAKDLEDCRQSGHRVVILGPDTSDAVPALWFLLHDMVTADSPCQPPNISAAATWSVLDDPSRVTFSLPKPGKSKTPNTWANTLSRALGLSADESHLLYSTPKDREAIERATANVDHLAHNFIQYAQADENLVRAIRHQLVDVDGFRRVAILYRDSSTLDGTTNDNPPNEPDRRLYGPALRDDFRKEFAPRDSWRLDLFLDAPFSKAPSDTEAFNSWEKAMEMKLRPVLRYFERERVEAVGVFGNTREKVSILGMVRRQLPTAQQFTSDPDWKLESPEPPSDNPLIKGPVLAGSTNPGGTKGSDYQLDGLLLITNAAPERQWVQTQFVNLNEIADERDEPFLPDIFSANTSHIVLRLIELAQGSRSEFGLLNLARTDETDRELARNTLERSLRQRVDMGFAERVIESAATGRKAPQVMFIQNGRLRSMVQSGLPQYLLVTIILASISLLFVLLVRSERISRGDGTTRRLTLWEQIFHAPWRFRRRTTPITEVPTTPPESETAEASLTSYWEPNVTRGMFAAVLAGGVALLPLIFFWLDTSPVVRSEPRQISLSLLPDGHSVLPTLLIYELVAILALYRPYAFHKEIEGRGRIRIEKHKLGLEADVWDLKQWCPPLERTREQKFDRFVQEWRKMEVDAHLGNDPTRWIASLFLAGLLTTLDLIVGIPLPFGFTLIVLALYEFGMLVIVFSTAFTFVDMARAVARLGDPLYHQREPRPEECLPWKEFLRASSRRASGGSVRCSSGR